MPEEEEPTTEAESEEPAAADEGSEVEPQVLPDEPTLAAIVEPFPSATWTVALDEWVVGVDPAEYHGLVAAAKDAGFETFIDLCAVDYFRRRPRFDVVLTVLNYTSPKRLRINVGVDGAEPAVATVSDVYPGANFYEREAYDLLGIEFNGHPDLTRILMPDDWQGHPLRKDYAVGTVPIQFKEAHTVE